MHPNDERQLAERMTALLAILPRITRTAAIVNAASLWPANSEVYSMDAPADGGYRRDCSGGLSLWLGIPLDAPGSWHGVNTVGLLTEGYLRPIRPADLRQGDVVGIVGPGTEGAKGHVRLFDRWDNDDPANDDYWCWEQAIGATGPDYAKHTFEPSGPYRAYEYVAIVDELPPAPQPEPQPGGAPAEGEWPNGDYVTVEPYQDGPGGPAWNSTLSGIAGIIGTTVDALVALNPEITDRNLIFPAQRVRVR